LRQRVWAEWTRFKCRLAVIRVGFDRTPASFGLPEVNVAPSRSAPISGCCHRSRQTTPATPAAIELARSVLNGIGKAGIFERLKKIRPSVRKKSGASVPGDGRDRHLTRAKAGSCAYQQRRSIKCCAKLSLDLSPWRRRRLWRASPFRRHGHGPRPWSRPRTDRRRRQQRVPHGHHGQRPHRHRLPMNEKGFDAKTPGRLASGIFLCRVSRALRKTGVDLSAYHAL
jgi:hypothetical protein